MKNEEYFSQFSEAKDEKFLAEVAEAEKSNGEKSFDEVKDGKYEVRVTDMTIKKSKKGEWMLQVTFKILAGNYKNRLVWAYYLLRPQNVYFAKKFLESLDSKLEIKYESELQFAKLVEDVFNTIDEHKEYGLEIKTSDKGFRNYKIFKVFDVEPEELPFS